MPLYDFKCKKCGKVFENFCCINEVETFTIKSRCPDCKGKVDRLIGGVKKDWFKVFTSEDFDGTPIEVTSKRHLRELCKKHKVYSRALM